MAWGTAGSDERAPRACAIGEAPADLSFTDLRFLPRTLDEFGVRKAFALVFVTEGCPLAGRYLPRLAELHARFAPQGAQFALVDVTPGGTVLQAATMALEHGALFPVLADPEGAAARSLGVTRSPEAVVLDASFVLRYRGRIDDQYRAGGAKPKASREELADALDAVLAGGRPRVEQAKADGCALTLGPPAREASPPSWSEHVAPLLHRHCADCHRDGGGAPFPLLTAEDATRRARVIAEAVTSGRMPPWHGTTGTERFANRRGLTPAEVASIAAWADAGGPVGDRSRAPAPPPAPPSAKWRIGEPDLVLSQLAFTSLPAEGVVPYEYVVLPRVFMDDTWIEAVEIRAANPRVLHHANLAYFQVGEPFRTENFITGLVPGGDPMVLDPGTAVRVPKGSVLGLQIHYVTTGKPEVDRVSVALRFPRERVRKRLRCHQVGDLRFEIPPGAEAHEVRASRTLRADSTLVGLYAHMHVRGRDMSFFATPPGGERETLLVVPAYDFEWQQSYRYPPAGLPFPKGTRLDVVAHFDNSAFNPYNPDPTAAVRFGLQTTDEMMYGFVFYTEDGEDLGIAVDPRTGKAVRSEQDAAR